MKTLVIESGQGSYGVDFVAGVADVVAQIRAIDNPFIIIDAKVAAIYETGLAPLADLPILHLAATEEEKTLRGVERVCAFLQRYEGSKRSTLVAIGGGIVQDITTFAAHIYYRGIPFVYVPTTLLSMSDSCIGAKCALNFGSAKNQIGFFQSPRRVLIATVFLDSLADDDVRSGFGEIVKLALIGSAEDFGSVVRDLDANGLRGPHVAALIARSLQIKQATIEIDEYESGPRKILNYGHTFGHALEAITDHQVPHGIAVAWGCDLANYIAASNGYLDAAGFENTHAVLSKTFGFSVAADYDAPSLVEKIKRDKKASGGIVQLILMRGPGAFEIVPTPIDARLTATVDAYVRTKDIFQKATIPSRIGNGRVLN